MITILIAVGIGIQVSLDILFIAFIVLYKKTTVVSDPAHDYSAKRAFGGKSGQKKRGNKVYYNDDLTAFNKEEERRHDGGSRY